MLILIFIFLTVLPLMLLFFGVIIATIALTRLACEIARSGFWHFFWGMIGAVSFLVPATVGMVAARQFINPFPLSSQEALGNLWVQLAFPSVAGYLGAGLAYACCKRTLLGYWG